jgi:hypothetical protein
MIKVLRKKSSMTNILIWKEYFFRSILTNIRKGHRQSKLVGVRAL